MVKIGNKRLLPTNKLYNSTDYAALLEPNKRNPKGKSYVHMKGTDVKKQENTTTKQLSMWKNHANEIHTKLFHPGEDRICMTTKNIICSIKEVLWVSEDFALAKSRHKLPHKVAKERHLKTDEKIYLYIIPQKKPSYGGSNNWIRI